MLNGRRVLGLSLALFEKKKKKKKKALVFLPGCAAKCQDGAQEHLRLARWLVAGGSQCTHAHHHRLFPLVIKSDETDVYWLFRRLRI